ncbi:MAG: ABC transporter permease [Clostridia bacterium]|nr:ABC transporter permease [Clostridia bacterium]
MRKISYAQILLIIMFAIISLFVLMMANSYFESQKDDMYYNEFYSSYMRSFEIKYGNGSDFPYDKLGNNYAVYYGISEAFDRDNDYIRAVYMKGNVAVPNITKGRFFTAEEFDNGAPVAVLGNLCSRNVIEKNGEEYYNFAGVDYKVIGYMGREDEVTDLDNMVWLNMVAYFDSAFAYGKFYIDGGNEVQTDSAVTKLLDLLPDDIRASSSEIVHERRFRSISYFTQRIYDFIIAAIIVNIAIVSVFYAEKRKYRVAVKRMIGASYISIAAEIIGEYALFALSGVVVGIITAFLLRFTAFVESDEVMLMTFSVRSVLIMLVVTVACSVIISVLPVMRLFRQDMSDVIK